MLQKKIKLGWPHIQWNDETERYDFLYIRKQHQESLTKCWRAYMEGEVKASKGGASSVAGVSEPEASTTETPPPAPPALPAPSRSKRPKREAPSKEPAASTAGT
eukprot:380872-Lingulodinium_polyedra.AAC.1